jgi:uncharacterized protein YbjQ (UPF0145 family)
MDVLIQFVVLLVLLAIGWLAGRANEQRHFRELAAHEAKLRRVLVFSERRPPADQAFERGVLVTGSVVIAEDYFKRIAAGLRSLVGGRIGVYESLLDRGRREAIVRMKEEASRLGATMIFNVRLETASLSEDRGGRSPMFSAEFIAYGTALVPAPSA